MDIFNKITIFAKLVEDNSPQFWDSLENDEDWEDENFAIVDDEFETHQTQADSEFFKFKF